jgi:hypothetical protein
MLATMEGGATVLPPTRMAWSILSAAQAAFPPLAQLLLNEIEGLNLLKIKLKRAISMRFIANRQ